MIIYETGQQPCGNFKSKSEDYRWSGNVHSCFQCEDSTVSFCENCSTDHHANGYEACQRMSDKK